MRVDAALQAFGERPISLFSVDELFIDEAVALKSVHSISYADAPAAALFIRHDLPLVTGDPELRSLGPNGLSVVWVGA